MIFLSNDDVEKVLDMASCLDVIEQAYRELVEHRAAYRPRIDLYVPQEPHYYRWSTMEGASRERGVVAIRMKSDVLAWDGPGEVRTEDKFCIEPGTYCGLVFLLSVKDGRPLALMNDGYLQHMRVGACAGIGTKYLAKDDASILAMIGSGGMAKTYASAIALGRSLEEIRVFSPTRANREKYASEMSDQMGIPVKPMDSPQAAVKGADIVALCTDSLVPVIQADWLEPGMHVANVRGNEAGAEVLSRVDVMARLGTSNLLREGSLAVDTVVGADGITSYIAGTADEASQIPAPKVSRRLIDSPEIATIPDLIAGRWAGRTSDEQITFLSNVGTQGLQFAAVGGLVLERAREADLGYQLPESLFLQHIRD